MLAYFSCRCGEGDRSSCHGQFGNHSLVYFDGCHVLQLDAGDGPFFARRELFITCQYDGYIVHIDILSTVQLSLGVHETHIVQSVRGLRQGDGQLCIGCTRIRHDSMYDLLAINIFRQQDLIHLGEVRTIECSGVARHTMATGSGSS